METVIVKIGRKYSFVKLDEIKWIESDRGYLKIFVENKYYIVRMTLKEITKKLDTLKFIRISRSKVINIFKIKEVIDSENANDYVVVLNDNTMLKWGRRYRNNFPEFLLIK